MFRFTTASLLLLLALNADAFSVAPAEIVVAAPSQLAAQEQALLSTTTSVSSALSQRDLLLSSVGSSTLSLSAAAVSSPIVISDINYDGKVPTTESDEYVVLTNAAKEAMDISGYYVYVATSGTQGATFTFPAGSMVKGGSSVRIYTNEIHKESGGYSFGSGKAIWNNRGGLDVLKDAKGGKLGEFKYKPAA